jgi:hypothetical protein
MTISARGAQWFVFDDAPSASDVDRSVTLSAGEFRVLLVERKASVALVIEAQRRPRIGPRMTPRAIHAARHGELAAVGIGVACAAIDIGESEFPPFFGWL